MEKPTRTLVRVGFLRSSQQLCVLGEKLQRVLRAARKTHAVFHNFLSVCAKRRRFANQAKRRMADEKPLNQTCLFEVLSTTSCAPPSTMLTEDTSVRRAFSCSSRMVSAPQLHMVERTFASVCWTLSESLPA